MDRPLTALRWACVVIGLALALGMAHLAYAPPSAELAMTSRVDEPITVLTAPPAMNPLRVALGERLFNDVRLSRDNSRSCASCHDLNGNGASHNRFDHSLNGSDLPLNTTTVFNATLNFRLGWEGRFRTPEAHAAALLKNPRIMDTRVDDVVAKLKGDFEMVRRFHDAYGRAPDVYNLLDAIASFERSLVTPGSRFDLWLAGDATALSDKEREGYQLFTTLGCSSCHQGMNVGGNLFQRHGIFHPLARPDPAVLRVPSLRNIATTAPYFHDGSAPTLDEAVRRMGIAQLNSTLTTPQVEAIVAFLNTLTGKYRNTPVGAPR